MNNLHHCLPYISLFQGGQSPSQDDWKPPSRLDADVHAYYHPHSHMELQNLSDTQIHCNIKIRSVAPDHFTSIVQQKLKPVNERIYKYTWRKQGMHSSKTTNRNGGIYMTLKPNILKNTVFSVSTYRPCIQKGSSNPCASSNSLSDNISFTSPSRIIFPSDIKMTRLQVSKIISKSWEAIILRVSS